MMSLLLLVVERRLGGGLEHDGTNFAMGLDFLFLSYKTEMVLLSTVPKKNCNFVQPFFKMEKIILHT